MAIFSRRTDVLNFRTQRLSIAPMWVVLACILSGISACSHNKAQIESKTYSTQIWPKVHTFAFSQDSKLANEKLAGISVKGVREKIEASIREELTLRNIKEVEKVTQADIIVTYLGASIQRVGMQSESEVFSDSATVGSATHTDTGFNGRSMVDYNEGALVIVASDPKTGEDLWQGRAKSNLKVDVSERKRDMLITESVKKIFDTFPKIYPKK
ncbi:hypothetical protein TDB9533_02803 [Thalassocella blandensis]|nr:hypothetical protein TDB9533_02803 [Thalassocella blandensis]